METIKINRNNISSVLLEIPVLSIKREEDVTTVKLREGKKHNVSIGDYLVFKSYVRRNETFTDSSYLISTVMDIIDPETFTITSTHMDKYMVVDAELLGCGWYKVTLDRSPKVQATNIEEYREFESVDKGHIMTFYDDSMGTTCFSDNVVSPYGYVDIDKSLYDYGIVVDGNITDDMLFVKDIEGGLESIYPGMYVEFPFDSIFYYDNSGFGLLWDTSVAYKDVSYYNVPVGLATDDEWRNMYQDVIVNDIFVGKVIGNLSTDPIDMEKIKYIPAYKEGDELIKITGLTFNFHFRNRLDEEGWHTTPETEGWNNGITSGNMYSDEDLLNKSDLVSYLDFTDNDIENQKKKVSKSFMRLSFYDSIDPVEQRLLYYSTVFLDAGTLFGRYVKKKRDAYDRKEQWDEADDPKHIVKKEGETEEDRVSSQITITDEYDLTKSSEGFNLYLFAADAEETNEEKTIYMKVEFNHAGYGRTIPFVGWPREGEEGPVKKLTISNYLKEGLYIPLVISHFVTEDGLTDEYVYRFDRIEGSKVGGAIKIENDNLIFNLFEPKIEIDEE